MLWAGHESDSDVKTSKVDRGYTTYSEEYLLGEVHKIDYDLWEINKNKGKSPENDKKRAKIGLKSPKSFPQFFPKGKKMGWNPKILPQILVPLAGLEPARTLVRGILSPLRLPIPPQRRVNVKFFVKNSQIWLWFSTHMLLSPVRLPIPPRGRGNYEVFA